MTDLSKHKYVFLWKIKNFLSCHIDYDNKLVSPTFNVNTLPVEDWELWLFPKGNSGSTFSQDQFIAFLMRKRPDDCSESITLDVTLEVLNIDGFAVMNQSKENCELEQNGYWDCALQTTEEFNQHVKGWDEDTLIIRCTIMTNDVVQIDDELELSEFEAVTIIDVDRFILKWNVFNTGCFDWNENVSFPNLTLPSFEITLSAEPDETVKISIIALNDFSQDEEVVDEVVFRIKFLSASGYKLYSICETHLVEDNSSLVLPKAIKLKDLYYGNSSLPCFKYTFITECTFPKKSISWSKIEKVTANFSVKKEIPTLASFPSSLLHDFRDLFLNKKHSDVKLRVNNVDFPAHKVVLGTRSPVFSAMFDQDMLENQSGIVNIEDVDEKTLQNLLEFVYTDVISEMDCEGALNLLLAADKYQISNLTDKCTSMVLSLLSTENVREVIVVADMIHHERLKSSALNVILENASVVLSAPNWYLWIEENLRLGTEILCKLSSSYLRRGGNN